MKQTQLPSGESVPALGQGTWGMGVNTENRQIEISALRFGLELGMTLIDTAEMYGDGEAERIVGDAINGKREAVFLVSKFYPHHATSKQMIAACNRSLKRLQTDYIDLYLLHWRGDTPLQETLEGFQLLLQTQKIRYWGVSNFELTDMEELVGLPNGASVATNQVLYNLLHRGIEWDLLPWCLDRHIPIMAYSPIEQGNVVNHPTLKRIALRHNAKPAQIALAWLLRQEGLITIPKASQRQHLQENYQALAIRLSPEDLRELNQAFPPPTEESPLDTI